MKNLTMQPRPDVRKLTKGETYTLKMYATADMTVGAISMILDYDQGVLDIIGVDIYNDVEYFKGEDNEGNLRIAWFSMNSLLMKTGEPFGEITVKIINDVPSGYSLDFQTTDDPEVNFGDPNAGVIPNVVVEIDTLVQLAKEAPKLLVRERKALQEYQSPIPKPYCKKCVNYANLRERRCDTGDFIVSVYATCKYYSEE